MTIHKIEPIFIDEPSHMIQWGAYQLPSCLFYHSPRKKDFVSPAANFDPGAALQNNPWQSLMPPSEVPKPKTLVLTVDIFRWQHSRDQWLALIHWLEQRGFVIYLCTQDEDDQIQLLPADAHLNGDTTYSLLERLTSFNKAEDYETLTNQYNLPRAHVEVLDRTNLPGLLNCVAQPIRYVTGSEILDISAFMALRPGWVAVSEKVIDRNRVLINPNLIAELIKKDELPINQITEPDWPSPEPVATFIAKNPKICPMLNYLFIYPEKRDEFLAAAYHPFIADINSSPGLIEMMDHCPELQNKIIKFFMENLDNITSCSLIAVIIKNAPHHTRLLVEKKWDVIKKGSLSLSSLETIPEIDDEFWNRYYHRNISFDELKVFIKFFPHKAPELIDEFIDKIQDDDQLCFCIDSHFPSAEKILIRHAKMIGLYLINRYNDLIVELLLTNKITIENGYVLALFIKNSPHQAKQLLKDHAGKIKNVYELSNCCESLTNINDVKELIPSQFHIMDNLFFFLGKNPRLFFWFIKNYGLPFKTAEQLNRLVSIYCPERFEWSTNYSECPKDDIREPRRLQAYYDRMSEQKALQYTAKEKVTQFSLADITYLYLNNNDLLEFIISAIKQGKIPNLIIVEISVCFTLRFPSLTNFIKALRAHCPHIKRILLPENLRQHTFNVPYQISYHERPSELIEEQKEPVLSNTQEKTTNTLYIANNGLNTNIDNNNENGASFQMNSVGELLNQQGQTLHRLRTGIIEVFADYTQQRYRIPVLTPIPTPRLLSDEDIQAFKKVKSNTTCYYKFPTELIAGQTIRLLSADSEEALLGIQVTSKKPLNFWRGNDGFFYCLATENCQLTHFIKADSVEMQQKKLASIPNNDPVMAIIREYKNSPKYRPIDTGKETSSIPKNNKQAWLETLYKNRSGGCAYRCYAVSYVICKNAGLSQRVRLVYIDNNHMRLEVWETRNKRWLQVDLGGSPGELIYNNRNIVPSIDKNKPYNDRKADRQASLKALIYQQSKSERISNKQDICSLVLQQQNLTCLVVSKDLDTQANAIIEQARLNNMPLFYLDKPKQYGSDKPKIILDAQAEPIVSQHDALDLFLEKIKNASAAIILVNWKAFSPQERIALNTLIDAYQKSVYGKPCPLWLKVISLYPTPPKDTSVRTRHKHYVSTLVAEKNANQKNNEIKTYLIDAQGYPNWQAYLFGPIVLIDNQLVWKKGPLTERLLQENDVNKNNTKTVIEIINLPTKDIKAFNHWINEAKAAGAFCYYGYDIVFPESVMLDVKAEPFSFKQFPPVNVCENVTAENILPDCRLINATLFDYLLKTKSCVNGQYRPLKGWLSSAKNQTLSLFVTSELSTNQWYCLFATAQQKQVTLALYLAPGVVLPNDLEKIPLTMPIQDVPFLMKNRLFVCNQSQSKTAALRQEKKMLCFAVDDYTYKDLVGGIDYKYTPGIGFHDFKEETSDLMIALEKGTDILLHGQFSTGLLEALAPLLLKSWPGQLTLVIEDKQLSEASLSKPYPNLNWLPAEAYQLSLQSEPIASPIVVTEPLIPVGSDHIDLTDSEQRATDFIQSRFQVMLDLLPKYRMLQLIGSTGVGKSCLMSEFGKKYCDDITVYHELNQIEAYASDRSAKTKVLFIDESNMEDVHLTVFDPLKKREDNDVGEVITLLYQGKFLFLTSSHWVVFARNAHDFGGGRHQQNLYADGTIPEFRLEDMPPAFIFERMLKPILNMGLSQKALPPEEARALAISFLTRYYKDNQAGILTGVRELQERVLTFSLHQDPEQSSFMEDQSLLPNRYFVPTPSTTEIRRSLHDFTMIRKMLHLHRSPAGMGLNCFIIEGKPGNGKTELIRHHFEQMGCQEAHLGDVNDQNGYFYYKVDASLPLKKKEKYFIDACEKGYKIWLDEINSCLDDGLEKITNNVLSGKHPVTGRYGTLHPRFGLIVSVNSMSLKGRSLLGPAFRARALEKKMPEPSLDDLRTIIEYRFRGTSLENTDIETMAQDLYACFFETEPKLSLRFIVPKLIKAAGIYPFNPDNLPEELREATEDQYGKVRSFLKKNIVASDELMTLLIGKANIALSSDDIIFNEHLIYLFINIINEMPAEIATHKINELCKGQVADNVGILMRLCGYIDNFSLPWKILLTHIDNEELTTFINSHLIKNSILQHQNFKLEIIRRADGNLLKALTKQRCWPQWIESYLIDQVMQMSDEKKAPLLKILLSEQSSREFTLAGLKKHHPKRFFEFSFYGHSVTELRKMYPNKGSDKDVQLPLEVAQALAFDKILNYLIKKYTTEAKGLEPKPGQKPKDAWQRYHERLTHYKLFHQAMMNTLIHQPSHVTFTAELENILANNPLPKGKTFFGANASSDKYGTLIRLLIATPPSVLLLRFKEMIERLEKLSQGTKPLHPISELVSLLKPFHSNNIISSNHHSQFNLVPQFLSSGNDNRLVIAINEQNKTSQFSLPSNFVGTKKGSGL